MYTLLPMVAALCCCAIMPTSAASFPHAPAHFQAAITWIDNNPTAKKAPHRGSAEEPYTATRNDLRQRREKLWSAYQAAPGQSTRNRILDQAGQVLTTSIIDQLMPYWYGTPWDFNGHTDIPQQGQIACGYLVSTLLKHAGFRLDRYQMARQSALSALKTLQPRSRLKHYSHLSPADLVRTLLKEHADGLYVLGQDFHIGFILVEDCQVYFIHSSYLEPVAVVREKALDSEAFAASTHHYLGAITHNRPLILKWLKQATIPVVLDPK